MKDKIQKIIAQMESGDKANNEAIQMLKELIEEPKWEPKRGGYTLHGNGTIFPKMVSDNYRQNGAECTTEEQAKILRDMTRRNNLIFQAKMERGYKDGAFEINYSLPDTEPQEWHADYVFRSANPELSFDTQEHAEEVIRMVGLNDKD